MYADCRSNVLVHGETGVGKERVARLLHDRAAWADGPLSRSIAAPFPKDCSRRISSATPRGVHRCRRRAQGLFRAGQWRHAVPGRDRRPAAVPAGQAVAGAGAEHGHAPGLGDRSAGGFPAGRRHQQDLRVLVAQDEFRADLYYRLAVIELRIPSLEQRGAAERSRCSAPCWSGWAPGTSRRTGCWNAPGPPATRAMCASCPAWPSAWPSSGASSSPGTGRASSASSTSWPSRCAARRDGRGRRAVRAAGVHRCRTGRARPHPGRAGRQRLAPAGHRQYLGISRKVLWEKMRKLHLGGGQGETADGMVEAS